ncbi:MAG: hypothetical protein KKE00_05370 [Proteobacteria bacterium]|nr:hypothetical protein [Pseudomonadota bacterium]MBU1569937.1 hypothetical protein [Pseudomonadota bacterium]
MPHAVKNVGTEKAVIVCLYDQQPTSGSTFSYKIE